MNGLIIDEILYHQFEVRRLRQYSREALTPGPLLREEQTSAPRLVKSALDPGRVETLFVPQ
jgi:hypothetical protein